MIVIIDNYDSFTYNLVQLIGVHVKDFRVYRNDAVSVSDLQQLQPGGIVLSPGPGRPENAGICVEIVRRLGTKVPLLGVCLGHQAIGLAFGGKIVHAPELMHGKTSRIVHQNDPLYRNVPSPFEATRYHSLVVSSRQFPAALLITAQTPSGVIMGIRHRTNPITGIQYHPESILTPEGTTILRNWLDTTGERS